MALIRKLIARYLVRRPKNCFSCRFHDPASQDRDGYVTCCVRPPLAVWAENRGVWQITRPTVKGSNPACKEGLPRRNGLLREA